MKTNNDYIYWTKEQFSNLPERESFSSSVECDAIIIIPMRSRHSSGFRNMSIVAVNNGKPICKCAGGSDVLMLGGIDGGNKYDLIGNLPRVLEDPNWHIDCLPVSGYLRLWCDYNLQLGADVSTFDVYYKEKKR